MPVSDASLAEVEPVLRSVLAGSAAEGFDLRAPGTAAVLVETLARHYRIFINVESRPSGFVVEVWRPVAGQQVVKTIDAVVSGTSWPDTVLVAVVMMVQRGVLGTAESMVARAN